MRVLLRLLRFILGHPLTGRRPVPALMRLLRWQIGGRISGMPAVVPFVGPTRLLLARGQSSATATYYVGLTDFAEMAFVVHLLRRGDLMGDIGANVGVYSLLAAGVAGAEVLAVEPAAATLPALHDNIRLNDLGGRVTVLPVALGEASGGLRLSAARGAANRVLRTGEGDAAQDVAVTTLDLVFADRTPLLLKLDVEGYELRILAGGPRLLADAALRAVLVETTQHAARYGDSVAGLDATLRAAGFAPFDYDPRRRSLAARSGPSAPNTLYLRDMAFCAARVRDAPPITVFGERI